MVVYHPVNVKVIWKAARPPGGIDMGVEKVS